MFKYRYYKNFSNEHFKSSLNENLANITELDWNNFEEIILNLLSFQAPFKERMVKKNQRVFVNKKIHKAIMTRYRLRNKCPREKLHSSEKQIIRNYCVKLIRKNKIKCFCNLNVNFFGKLLYQTIPVKNQSMKIYHYGQK